MLKCVKYIQIPYAEVIANPKWRLIFVIISSSKLYVKDGLVVMYISEKVKSLHFKCESDTILDTHLPSLFYDPISKALTPCQMSLGGVSLTDLFLHYSP